MTLPAWIKIKCKCGAIIHKDGYASINLMVDPDLKDYEDTDTYSCPKCGLKKIEEGIIVDGFFFKKDYTELTFKEKIKMWFSQFMP